MGQAVGEVDLRGGGRGAFIGAVHRIAANIDGQIELGCGAFSSNPRKSKASGKDFFLPAKRCYGTFQEMIEKEQQLPEGERMDFVSIVTPNHMHFPPAKMALENGFHVLSDKPATFDLKEAKTLEKLVKQSKCLYGLTHNYTGYPLVKEARDMIAAGKLGKIRKVVVEYPQGWLATRLEASGQKQADWRTDPKRSGAAGCIGDIGTHAENLAEYITGLKIKELAADITTFVKGRKLDDDGNVLRGRVISEGSRNCYLRSEHRLVVGLGVENLVVVETDDAVLIADRSQAQNVKTIVKQLEADGSPEGKAHRRIYRPWGSYESLVESDGFQVKRIIVQPGQKLSLQKHFHRAEHWIVVRGTAEVTRGDEVFTLSEDQSTYIPLGTVHRLVNPGQIPLELIEVQSGSYLGEDDIVRFEDVYGRQQQGS